MQAISRKRKEVNIENQRQRQKKNFQKIENEIEKIARIKQNNCPQE